MPEVSTQDDQPLRVRDLGRMAYGEALAIQRQTHADVLAGRAAQTLLLVEHEPVVTLGRRPGSERNLVASEAMLARAGVAVHPTDRGGDITYHGPGQLVAYPIVALNRLALNLRRYVWRLEQAIIDTLAAFDIDAGRDDCAVGVWVKHQGRPGAKIAAIGVRASRWVTMHGLALNVETNLDHFKLIVPCGLAGRPVTSMKQLLGDACPGVDDVKAELTRRLLDQLDPANCDATPLPRPR